MSVSMIIGLALLELEPSYQEPPNMRPSLGPVSWRRQRRGVTLTRLVTRAEEPPHKHSPWS